MATSFRLIPTALSPGIFQRLFLRGSRVDELLQTVLSGSNGLDSSVLDSLALNTELLVILVFFFHIEICDIGDCGSVFVAPKQSSSLSR